MAGKLSNSFALVKASAGVLEADKELLVFPALSAVASLLVAATFLVPAWATGFLPALADESGVVGYLFMFAFYLVQYFVVFFFNAALVGAALIRLDGGDPTVADGLNIAIGRLPRIVAYAGIAATVGMVLRALSERLGFLGRLVVGLIGLSWSLATYLVVPVLVTREVSATDAIKESASLFKRTWGEQVVGNVGLGLAFFVMFSSWLLFGALFLVLAANIGSAAVVPVIVVLCAGFLALALVASAMNGIYAAALYRFATTGEGSGGFDASVLSTAFREKRR